MAQNIKLKDARLAMNTSMIGLSPSSIQIPNTNRNANRMEGKKAMPPRRGTVPLCIFRGSVSSNRFLRNAISSICGMMNPASTATVRNALMSMYIQVTVYCFMSRTVGMLPMYSVLFK